MKIVCAETVLLGDAAFSSIGKTVVIPDREITRDHLRDADALIVRPRSNVDEATPSANALMGVNLMRLWRLTGKDAYRRAGP